MDKREIIEKALGRFCKTTKHYGTANFPIYSQSLDFDALTEQAVAIECEVEHIPGYDIQGHSDWVTCLRGCSPLVDGYLDIDGMKGTPGKALAIIIPLEEK